MSCLCAAVHTWRSENSVLGSVLSFHQVGPEMKLTSATSIFPCLKLILQFIQWITNPIQNGFFSFVWFFKCGLISLISGGREDCLTATSFIVSEITQNSKQELAFIQTVLS